MARNCIDILEDLKGVLLVFIVLLKGNEMN
jgi:hypothetical protein